VAYRTAARLGAVAQVATGPALSNMSVRHRSKNPPAKRAVVKRTVKRDTGLNGSLPNRSLRHLPRPCLRTHRRSGIPLAEVKPNELHSEFNDHREATGTIHHLMRSRGTR